MNRLSLIMVAMVTIGCTTLRTRPGYVSPRDVATLRTIEITARSSIAGRPMADDPSLRNRVAAAFRKQFPSARLVESQSDIQVIFVMVDYVPGCSPNCRKFKTYCSWTCEVTTQPKDPRIGALAMAFELEGSTYNPLFDPAASCTREFGNYTRR